MTDRHSGYLVTLAKDIREDDARKIIDALRMVRGVLTVEPVVSDLFLQQIAEQRADEAWRTRIHDMLDAARRT